MNEHEEKIAIEKNECENLNLALDLVKRKIDVQNINHNSLESKIGILLGFVGTLSAGLVALLQNKTSLLGVNIFTIGAIDMYSALVFLAAASKANKFLDPPDFQAFYSCDSLSKDNVDVKNQVVADMKAAYESNNRIQELKSLRYNAAIYCFLSSIIFLFLGIIEK